MAFGEKEGYGVFGGLATFGLAQAAALTTVAREEKYKILVLSIYAGTVLFTLVWTVLMLRAEREIILSAGMVAKHFVRAYDQPSIQYGRGVVCWTVLLAGVLIYLGYEGLLPNQSHRVSFTATKIDCDTFDTTADWPTPGGSQQFWMDEWMRKLDQQAKDANKEGFSFILQKTAFPESYKPFALTLKCDSNFSLGQRTAFLVLLCDLILVGSCRFG